jgi:hypothetical protein
MRISGKLRIGILLGLAAVLVTSCSGSGNSTGKSASDIRLSALVLPERVSVVDPNASSSAKPRLLKTGSAPAIMSGIALTAVPTTSDYVKDKTTVYVNERSLDAFDTVNSILCTIRQSRYDEMINKGPYKAQIDVTLCNSSRSNASTGGESSAEAAMPVYETDTFNSYRTSESAPHVVDVWAHPHDNPDQIIYGKVVITQDAETAPPYGLFMINFKSLDVNDLSTILARGLLDTVQDPATGKVLLAFSEEDANSYMIEKATLDKNPDGTYGAGSVYTSTSFPNQVPKTTRFDISYNTTNFLRTDNVGTQICLDRQTYDESVWKYGLYTAETTTIGSRVKVNAGFPVRKGSVYGWIGYWGAWFPDGTTLNNGDSVFKHDYATNTDTAFTVLKSGGRLKKYTQHTTTLGGINNVPLIWSDNTGTAPTYATYQIVWNGTGFTKVAQQDVNGTWQTISPSIVDLTVVPWVDLAAWSQAMNGMVIIHLPATGSCLQVGSLFDCSLAVSDASNVVFYKEDVVFPGDPVPATLACFDNCPDAFNLTTATPFRTDIMSYQSGTAPLSAFYASYSFDSLNMTLLDTQATPTPVFLSVSNPAFEGGISSGPLFAPTTTNLNLLACDWDSNSTCGGSAWTVLPVFYVWETGPNAWNQFITVKNGADVPVKFDPPLQVRYTHVDATSPYNGRTFYLQYNGFGDLSGIPGMCVNLDTGAKNVDCSLSSSDPAIRWVPEFNIPDRDASGNLTEVTDMGTGTAYIVKTLEKEQRMSGAPLSACSAITTQPYQLPSMSSWVNPILGTEPVITAPPEVIGGVVQ